MMNKSEMIENVKKAKTGDKGAFSILYQHYSPLLKKYLVKLGADYHDAEDISAETFMEVIEEISSLKNDEYFSTWMYSIAKNKFYTLAKAANKHQRVEFSSYSEEGDTFVNDLDIAAMNSAQYSGDEIMLPEDFAANEDIKRKLAEIINSLGDKEKETVYLRYYEGYSVSEISKETKAAEGTVKARLHHARKYIEKKVKELQSKGYVLSVTPFPAEKMYNILKKSKYAELITPQAAAVVTAGRSLAIGLASVLTAGVVGFTAVFGMGLFHNKDGDKWDIKDDSSIVVEEEKKEEDIDYSEYEMPDELKNLEWTTKNIEHDPQYTANDYYYLINDTAQSVPLLEDGIEDVRILLLDGFRYNEDKHLLQFIWTPYCSKPTDYVMLEPSFSLKESNSLTYKGTVYCVNEKVLFNFNDVFNGIDGFSFSDIDDHCFNTLLSTQGKEEYRDDGHDYVMGYQDSGSHKAVVNPNGIINSSIFNQQYYNDIYSNSDNNIMLAHVSSCVLKNDYSIIIDSRVDAIPKLYLGEYDENEKIVNDPFRQNPYSKIKKISVSTSDNLNKQYFFEIIDGILYSCERELKKTDKSSLNEYGSVIKRELLWVPPVTHYNKLQLPDNLVKFYNNETITRLNINADVISMGFNSNEFIKQLKESDNNITQSLLHKIDNIDNSYIK